MSKQPCFIGVDTSNYTTSVAACTLDGEVIGNFRRLLPVKEGECGLRQSDAVFAHVKQLPMLLDELDALLDGVYEPIGVGVSTRPRRVEGSYMPCFLAGVSASHALTAGRGIPLYEFSHQEGHVMAAAYSSGCMHVLFQMPFLAFHVSGGTTEALLVKPLQDGFDISLAGGTADLNAGQAIDRVGVHLGLPFPCGVAMEQLASGYQGRLEKKPVCVRDGFCHLSGLENMAKELYAKTQDKQATSAFVFDFICRSLLELRRQIFDRHGTYPVLYAGGVMSNRLMRGALGKGACAYFAEAGFSSDNAAGIALLARRRYLGDMQKKEQGSE